MTALMHPRDFVLPQDPPANVRLVGRYGECAVLDRLVEAARAGTSRALVLSGEPGVGKTALLDYVVERASNFRVARASGVESEMEMVFAGLHQLCAPLLDRLERLPVPQREALRTAFGLSAGPAPDRFQVGLATLGLLAETAREAPLVCVIDDAQWLDLPSVQTLAFVARRLAAESVALVVATRTPDESSDLTGLPQLRVEGLPDADARALLRSTVHGRVDEGVLDRIIAETRGNPQVLLELREEVTSAELAGVFRLADNGELPEKIEENYRRLLAPLPAATQELLLVAAAEPLGDPVLVWRAAQRLGIGIEAAASAAAAGLLEIGERVRFRHPLLRSAIYRAAPAERRRATRRALAEATDPEADPDRRAWHAAHAALGPDEDIAAELERSVGRAHARGGLAAAAAFLERAAELTLDGTRRAQRALAAAHATHQAGMPDAALRLLSLAEAGPPDKLVQAQADRLRGEITFSAGRADDAAPLLRAAATQLEPLDIQEARETHLEAIWAAWFANPSTHHHPGLARKAAQDALAAPPAPHPPRPVDLLLDGLATRLTDGYVPAMPIMRRALNAFRTIDRPDDTQLRWLWLACANAAHVWDDQTWEALAIRQLQLTRDTGGLAMLPLALTTRIAVHAYVGELGAAAALAEEQAAVAEATGSPLIHHGMLWVAAWQGHETETHQLMHALSTHTNRPRRGSWADLTIIGRAKALLYNSLGRYEDALTAARPTTAPPSAMGATSWGMHVELIEAASRSDTPEYAAHALQELTEATRASGTNWALGLQARCRALCTDGATAETSYLEAIDRLSRTRIRTELARAHLLYGEWLRRKNRRLDAREQLRTAHQMFTTTGMNAFAQRAAHELKTTGETARKRIPEPSTQLTPQENQIARLVGQGLSNPEIAARLFISRRTVEWHLGKIFTKLNVTSRRQLRLAA